MTAPLALEARGLVKTYGSVTAINGADFELRAGEVLAVIGDNGAGKSSLIKALAGAVIPDSGEILMNGSPVSFVRSDSAITQSRSSGWSVRTHRSGCEIRSSHV